MKRVEGFAHLYVRDGRFLVRVQVPAAARHRVGRRELKSALGGDFVLAKKRYPAALARLRSQVDFPDVLPVSGSRHEPTSDEINQVAREFRARLRPDIARISRDAGGGEMSRLEQVDLLISIAVSGAAKGLPGQTSLQARWLFDEMGWHGSDDSPAFGDLCNKLLRARLDRLREEKHRI